MHSVQTDDEAVYKTRIIHIMSHHDTAEENV